MLKSKYAEAASFLARKHKLEAPSEQSFFSKCVNICFSQQMSAYKGIKEFGERAIEAMFKELVQLDQGAVHGKPVVTEIDPDMLSDEEKGRALDAVNIIELKRDGRIKGRSCANGSKQKLYLKEFDSVASPTVSLEGLFTMLLIAAYEGRKFISFDVPGAFLQADMVKDSTVLLKLRGQFAKMMCEVNPKYAKYLRYENGKPVLYLKVLRAIYGCIESAL